MRICGVHERDKLEENVSLDLVVNWGLKSIILLTPPLSFSSHGTVVAFPLKEADSSSPFGGKTVWKLQPWIWKFEFSY